MDKLSDCPFCGGVDEEYTPRVDKEIKTSAAWCIWAPCCDFYGPLATTPEEAIERWNKRLGVKPDSTLVSLQKERDHWRNNHTCEVARAKVLEDRIDTPLERTKAYELIGQLQTRIAELELEQ